MSILDQFGRPIEREQLQEPQTSRVGHLHTEYENHPSRGLTPPRLARILQDAEQGDLTAQHELFQDMEEKDGHLFSVMQTRRQALQRLDWSIVPAHGANAAETALAEYAEETIRGGIGDFGDLLFDMSDAIGHGFAALELQWQSMGRDLVPVCAVHRPQSWFKLSSNPEHNRNQLRLRDNSADGAELWPFGWVLHEHRARSGYIARSGLFRVMAWPFLFKNYAVRDLAEFLEIYGLPLRVGTYNPSATQDDKAALLRAVVGIGHNAAAIIPEGMLIDFKDAAQGDNKSFDAMIGLMERTMSKAALGGTLTSGEGEHGTQALGSVHNELRTDLRDSDARQVAATLTRRLVYPLLAVNKGLADVRRCPQLVFDTQEPENLKLFADAVPKLVGVGMRVPASWAHDKLKIPVAKEGEDVLASPAAAPAEPAVESDPSKTKAARLKAQPGGGADPDELDQLSAEMASEWTDSMGEIVEPLLAAANHAVSLEDFREIIGGELALIDPKKLADVLARGDFAARLWGQVNFRSPAERKPGTGSA